MLCLDSDDYYACLGGYLTAISGVDCIHKKTITDDEYPKYMCTFGGNDWLYSSACPLDCKNYCNSEELSKLARIAKKIVREYKDSISQTKLEHWGLRV